MSRKKRREEVSEMELCEDIRPRETFVQIQSKRDTETVKLYTVSWGQHPEWKI